MSSGPNSVPASKDETRPFTYTTSSDEAMAAETPAIISVPASAASFAASALASATRAPAAAAERSATVATAFVELS